MVTQAIKNWLRKLFAWWPWKQSTEREPIHAASLLHQGTTQGAVSRNAIDGVASQPQSGITQRLSTIEGWPERTGGRDQSGTLSGGQVSYTGELVPPPGDAMGRVPTPETPLPPPLTKSTEKATDIFSSTDAINREPCLEDRYPTGEPGRADAINRVPTGEQHLEFLHYLVKRGIVNEGFEEGRIPEQYRRE